MGTDINFKNHLGRTYGTRIGLPAFDPAASAFIQATGITGELQKAAINNLVLNLKKYNLWSKMKAVYPFVTDNYNLFSFTEDLTNVIWEKSSVTVTANQLAPDNTNTAFKLQNNVSAPFCLIRRTGLLSSPTAVLSFYVQKIDYDFIYIRGSSTAWYFVNLSTLATSNPNISISAIGNNWFRVSLKNDVNITWAQFGVGVAETDAAALGKSANFWHPQLQLGSTLTDYQPIATTQQAYIASQFKFNLVNPVDSDAAFRLVFNGGWTHSSTGALPNGTNGFADTKLSTSVLTNNSTHISYYSRSATSGSTRSEIGGGDPATNVYLQMLSYRLTGNYNGDQYYGAATLNRIDVAVADSRGYFIDSRTNSSTHKAWKSNVLIGSESNLQTNNISSFSQNIYIGGRNNGGSADLFSDRQSAFSTIGNGLTDDDATNLYYSTQVFQTTLGRQVGMPIVSDADAQAFLNSAEITDLTQANAINTLVTDLKAQGLWTKMKAVYPFVGGTASTHKWNLKDPRDLDAAYRLVFNGGWTHSSTGATPNGVNGYADTFFTQTSMGMFGNSHMSNYVRTVASPLGSKVEMGVGSSIAGTYSNLAAGFTGVVNINAGSRTFGLSTTDARGYLINSATTASLKLYKNGTLLGSDTSTQTSTPSTFFLALGAQYNSSIISSYTDRQTAFASIGDGLNDTEAASLYNSVNNFQVALSRNV